MPNNQSAQSRQASHLLPPTPQHATSLPHTPPTAPQNSTMRKTALGKTIAPQRNKPQQNCNPSQQSHQQFCQRGDTSITRSISFTSNVFGCHHRPEKAINLKRLTKKFKNDQIFTILKKRLTFPHLFHSLSTKFFALLHTLSTGFPQKNFFFPQPLRKNGTFPHPNRDRAFPFPQPRSLQNL